MVPSISNVAIACLLLLAASGCRSSAFVLPAPTTSRVTKNKTSNGGQSLIADASLPWASRRRSIYRYTTTLHYLHRPDSDTSSVNFYSVLGVTRDATESDIKGAFRKLAKLYHPGKQQESKHHYYFYPVADVVQVSSHHKLMCSWHVRCTIRRKSRSGHDKTVSNAKQSLRGLERSQTEECI